LVNISAEGMEICEFETVGNIVYDLALEDVTMKLAMTYSPVGEGFRREVK